MVIWRATCQSCEARSTSVQESWRVDQQATETRKVSEAVRAQRPSGRMHDGEIRAGSIEAERVAKSIGRKTYNQAIPRDGSNDSQAKVR